MPEYLRPGDITGNEPLKTRDVVFHFRGFYDREPEAVCRLRVFSRGTLPPVIVLTELQDNSSTSVTNAMEFLGPEVIRTVCPERFEHEEPCVLLEHYPEERSDRGKILHEETWDQVTFSSWAPRRVWLGGQERLSFGEPEWRRLTRDEVASLIGKREAEGR